MYQSRVNEDKSPDDPIIVSGSEMAPTSVTQRMLIRIGLLG